MLSLALEGEVRTLSGKAWVFTVVFLGKNIYLCKVSLVNSATFLVKFEACYIHHKLNSSPIGCHSNLLLAMTCKETEFFIYATILSNDHNKNPVNLLSDTH